MKIVFHRSIPGYGGFLETVGNVLKPDPDFVMGNVVVKSFEVFGKSFLRFIMAFIVGFGTNALMSTPLAHLMA